MCSIHSLETDFISLEKCHYSYRGVTKRYISLNETAGYKDQPLPFVSSIFLLSVLLLWTCWWFSVWETKFYENENMISFQVVSEHVLFLMIFHVWKISQGSRCRKQKYPYSYNSWPYIRITPEFMSLWK